MVLREVDPSHHLRSGSMSGFRLLLAKLASIALLDTLTPKDYFYVVSRLI